jgi:hypothetical protein
MNEKERVLNLHEFDNSWLLKTCDQLYDFAVCFYLKEKNETQIFKRIRKKFNSLFLKVLR